MVIRYPLYWKQFHCAAGQCPDTCCQGWDIALDPQTLKRYRKAKGNLGKTLRQKVDLKKSCLSFDGGVCPFLDSEGLCSIQKAGGVEMLSRACRLYPRHAEEYGSRREWSLSFSCPEAARLILEQEKPLEFAEKETLKKGRPDSEIDRPLLDILLAVRRSAIEISQDRRIPLRFRMAMVLAMAKDVQRRLELGREKEILPYIRRLEERRMASRPWLWPVWEAVRKNRREQERLILKWEDFLWELPPWEKNWRTLLKKACRALEAAEGEAGEGEDFSVAFEHILVSYLDLYLPGAVYDGDVLTKAKMALYHCLMLQKMETALETPVKEWLHIYARETEHYEENVKALERALKTRTEFRTEEIMACVLPAKIE